MKDVFAAFGSEVFRPVVTLLLPGALALSPWVVAGIWSSQTVAKLVIGYRTEAWVAAILLTLFIGLVCEDIGSHLEGHFDDRVERKTGNHKVNWRAYWRVAYEREPIGHHYLRTILLRLKFELGCAVACLVGLLGLWWLPTSYEARVVASAITLVVAAFFVYESHESHHLLGEIRAELLRGIVEAPTQTASTAQSRI
ncbi:MAG: hypothetical protein JST11_12240 [Acidobacteria bacterium]|nr:hypothetical protein [Acidobacteriota bacterium]